MRKVFLVSAIALAMAGCAAQEERASPQVRDLSASRESASDNVYTVESGDTLYGIAWRHDMDYRDLAQLNRISPPYRIQTGQQLRLRPEGGGQQQGASRPEQASPVTDSAVATATALGASGGASAEGNTDWLLPDEEAIARNRRLTAEPRDERSGNDEAQARETERDDWDEPEEAPADEPRPDDEEASVEEPEPVEDTPAVDEAEAVEQAEVAEEAEAASEPEPDAGTEVAGSPQREPEDQERTYTPVEDIAWQWPTDGDVVGRFGEGGSITAGIDIAGQKGQPVRSAGPGIVVYAGSGVRGYGNLILIKHNDQFLSAYAHNDTLEVTENDVVEAGDRIATMGDSDAENVRLHFEVRKDGQPQDPLEYLPER